MKISIHDIYRPFLRFFRAKRMQIFQEKFDITPESRILDVGGTPFNWSLLPNQPNLYIINLSLPEQIKTRISWIIADGKHLPFKDKAFDIAYSNSVIEHLGTIEEQSLFANEIQRISGRYFVQTPNKWFPIEPHYIALFIHWLPKSMQKKLMRNYTIRGLITRPTHEECEKFVHEIRLLEKKELQKMFADAEIWHERFFGWTKSFIIAKR